MIGPVGFPALDEYRLNGMLFKPEEPNGRAVLVNSATGVRQEYYAKYATYLLERGFTVLTYDYRGIGRSLHGPLKDLSHARMREAIEQYLFEERRDVLRLVTSAARPDEEARRKISVVQQRLIAEYGYDEHSGREALSYVTTLLAQE